MFKVAINLRATVNCLVTNIFQNIFLFSTEERNSGFLYTGLEQVEGEYRIFIFGWTLPLSTFYM